jgi:hypothetical protein
MRSRRQSEKLLARAQIRGIVGCGVVEPWWTVLCCVTCVVDRTFLRGGNFSKRRRNLHSLVSRGAGCWVLGAGAGFRLGLGLAVPSLITCTRTWHLHLQSFAFLSQPTGLTETETETETRSSMINQHVSLALNSTELELELVDNEVLRHFSSPCPTW